MSSSILFWNLMSDAWDSYEEKDLFSRLWIAYGRSFYTAKLALFQANIAKSLENILPYTKYVWISFNFDSTTLIDSTTYDTGDPQITSIPYLQEGINISGTMYEEGVDYTTGDSTIEWITTPTDSTSLWAPIVYKDEGRIAANWGVLIGEEVGDSQVYLDAVKGAVHSYWNGPTKRDIRNGLNIFYGQPFCSDDGVVFDSDSTSITMKYGYEDYETFDILNGEFAAHSIGDAVQKHDSITNNIEVFDYITHPRWWRTYSIDMINREYIKHTLTPTQQEEINQLTKYFTFGVKIDGEKYAAFDLLIPGMAKRFLDKIKPVYSNYLFIVNDNFRSIDPNDPNGDWLFFDDSTTSEAWEFNLTETFRTNYINYMASFTGYEATSPVSFDEYDSTTYESFDLDSDVIGLWEKLEIIQG